jgi:hypothetical protein
MLGHARMRSKRKANSECHWAVHVILRERLLEGRMDLESIRFV